MGRGAETRDADVAPAGADGRDGRDRDAQARSGIPRGRIPPSPPSASDAAAASAPTTAKLAPSPPNTNGNGRRAERIGDRRDHAGADHVDRLVAPLRDRLGRADDVGEADDPIVRQRAIASGLHRVGEIVEDGDRGVEIGSVAAMISPAMNRVLCRSIDEALISRNKVGLVKIRIRAMTQSISGIADGDALDSVM